jgi:hypothetical protein
MADTKQASTSLQVTFLADVQGDGAALVLELDQEAHKAAYGEERTRFAYGETVFFRAYPYPGEMTLSVSLSDGTLMNVAGQGLGLEQSGAASVVEAVTFANADQGTTTTPVRDGSLTVQQWLGNSLGALASQGMTLTSSSQGVAVARVAYTSDFRRYAFTLGSRPDEEYPVVVHVLGTME